MESVEHQVSEQATGCFSRQYENERTNLMNDEHMESLSNHQIIALTFFFRILSVVECENSLKRIYEFAPYFIEKIFSINIPPDYRVEFLKSNPEGCASFNKVRITDAYSHEWINQSLSYFCEESNMDDLAITRAVVSLTEKASEIIRKYKL